MPQFVKLLNSSTGKVESIPEDRVDEFVRSGQFRFLGTKDVPVHGPDGEGYLVKPEEVPQALEDGYVYDTSGKKQYRKDAKEFGSRTLEAVAAGLVRGPSLGLSDRLLVESGAASPETLRKLQEFNPVASTAAEVVGDVGSVLATGGTGLLAKGASLGAKAVLGAGKLAERQVAKALAAQGVKGAVKRSMARKLAEKALPTVAGAAAEGAVIGTGHLISEDALGRADLNAENLMASAGMGAILGGAGGLLFKGLEATIPAAMRMGAKGAQSLEKKYLDFHDNLLGHFGITHKQAIKAKIDPNHLTDFTKRDLIPSGALNSKEAFGEYFTKKQSEIRGLYQQADTVLPDVPILQPGKYTEFLSKEIKKLAPNSQGTARRALKKLSKDIEFNQLTGDTEFAGNFTRAKGFLDELDGLAKYNKLTGATRDQEAVRELRNIVRQDLNDAVERVYQETGDELFSSLHQRNQDIQLLHTLRKSLDAKAAKEADRPFFDFRSLYRGGAGAVILGGVDGGAHAFLLNKIATSEPAQMAKIRLLSKIHGHNLDIGRRIEQAVERVVGVSKKAKVGKGVQIPATRGLVDFFFTDEPKKKDESRVEAFHRISAEARKISNPEYQIDQVADRLATLDPVAPKTAQAFAFKMAQAAAFLDSVVPMDPTEGRRQLAHLRKWKPSAYEIDKFERYVQAINDPVHVIEQFADGKINAEGLQVLENVYPEIFSEFQTKVLVSAGEQKEMLPYKQRLLISNFLKVNLDTSTDPQSVMALQQTFLPTQDEQPAQGPSPKSPDKEVAQSYATESQQIQAGAN